MSFEKNALKLSIIIPAYNEEVNLRGNILDSVEVYLAGQNYPYEVVIVDDGSEDQTLALIKEQIKNKPYFRMIENPHGGKALAVMTGLMGSQGNVAVFTDMDQATPISQLEKLLPFFHQGFDIVIGSRYGRRGAPLIRKVSAWGFAFLRNTILGLPYKDTQCGFKGFTRDAINQIFPPLLECWQKKKKKGAAVNAGFDIEMLITAKKKNFKVAEVPVDWNFVGTERVQIIRDSYESIKDMLRIRFQK